MKIAIDMDEVLADFVAKDLEVFNKTFEKKLTIADIRSKGGYSTTLYPEYNQQMIQLRNTPEFFIDMKPIPGALQAVEEITAHHEVFIVSAAMHFPNSVAGKYEWLQTHLPCIHPYNYVFCGNKSIITADYLIDDSLRNLQGFAGQGILFGSLHNEGVAYPVRVNDWVEVTQYFKKEGLL